MFGPEKRKFCCCPRKRKPRIRPRRRGRPPATRRTRNSSSRYGTGSVFYILYFYRKRWIVYFSLDPDHKSLILLSVPRSDADPDSVCHFDGDRSCLSLWCGSWSYLFTLMRIRILFITLMRIRIQLITLIRIRNPPFGLLRIRIHNTGHRYGTVICRHQKREQMSV